MTTAAALLWGRETDSPPRGQTASAARHEYVVLVGHSFGAQSVVNAVNELGNQCVDLSVAIDRVDSFRGGDDYQSFSDNARYSMYMAVSAGTHPCPDANHRTAITTFAETSPGAYNQFELAVADVVPNEA